MFSVLHLASTRRNSVYFVFFVMPVRSIKVSKSVESAFFFDLSVVCRGSSVFALARFVLFVHYVRLEQSQMLLLWKCRMQRLYTCSTSNHTFFK
jgi:Gpi18-like mannosyltransferase